MPTPDRLRSAITLLLRSVLKCLILLYSIWIQNPLLETECGFKSLPGHQATEAEFALRDGETPRNEAGHLTYVTLARRSNSTTSCSRSDRCSFENTQAAPHTSKAAHATFAVLAFDANARVNRKPTGKARVRRGNGLYWAPQRSSESRRHPVSRAEADTAEPLGSRIAPRQISSTPYGIMVCMPMEPLTHDAARSDAPDAPRMRSVAPWWRQQAGALLRKCPEVTHVCNQRDPDGLLDWTPRSLHQREATS